MRTFYYGIDSSSKKWGGDTLGDLIVCVTMEDVATSHNVRVVGYWPKVWVGSPLNGVKTEMHCCHGTLKLSQASLHPPHGVA